jgi:tRNA uridine 5-carboxymethylaminomethyl modification enzyme
LSLRADNADLRLTRKGIEWGCVGSHRANIFETHRAALEQAIERAWQDSLPAAAIGRLGIRPAADGRRQTIMELAGNEAIDWTALCDAFPWLAQLSPRVSEQLRTDARYAGYLHRQQAELHISRREDAVALSGIRFEQIGGLSNELRDKLNAVQPASLGAASRIQGMTPAALASIAAHTRKRAEA